MLVYRMESNAVEANKMTPLSQRTHWLVSTAALLAMLVSNAWCGQVYETTSVYNHIIVEDVAGTRILRFNGSQESRMSLQDSARGHFQYTEILQLPVFWNPAATNVLMIGLGGGSTHRAYQLLFPEIHIDAVELDPVVMKVAKTYFGVRESRTLKFHEADGRVYLRRTKQKYDAILLDAYTSTRYGSFIPHHLATTEFFTIVRDHLTPNGVVMFNVIGNYQGWRADIFGAMYKTMNSVFPNVYHVPSTESQNIILIGAMNEGPLKRETKLRNEEALLKTYPRLPLAFWKNTQAIQSVVPVSAAKSPVLSDKFAPVDGLLNAVPR